MINSTDIVNAWQRLGWIEPSKTGYTSELDEDNKTTLSGKYFDAIHPLVNYVNFKDTYTYGSSASTLNAALKSLQQTGIITVAQDVSKENDFVHHNILIDDDFDIDNTLDADGKFVFVKITVPYGYVCTIHSVGISLDAVKTFNLYIFNNTQAAARDATTSIVSVANSEKWTALTCASRYLWGSTLALKSGVYYIGYFQDDIGNAAAIQREYYQKNSPCKFEYCYAEPNGTSLPAEDDISYTGYTYGINLDFTISRDFTPIYLKSPQLFDKAVGYYVVEQVLRQILLSDRFNSSERKAKTQMEASQLFVEINGSIDEFGKRTYKGISQLYYDEIEYLKKVLFKKTLIGTMQ